MNELIDFLKPYMTMIDVIAAFTIAIFLLVLYRIFIWIIESKYDIKKEEKKRLEENIRRITREEIWKREEDWRHVLDEDCQETN